LNKREKAAKSIQGKYAAIYGAIGAAILELGTLLCCGGKKLPNKRLKRQRNSTSLNDI